MIILIYRINIHISKIVLTVGGGVFRSPLGGPAYRRGFDAVTTIRSAVVDGDLAVSEVGGRQFRSGCRLGVDDGTADLGIAEGVPPAGVYLTDHLREENVGDDDADSE